jgi:hypothetical protein
MDMDLTLTPPEPRLAVDRTPGPEERRLALWSIPAFWLLYFAVNTLRSFVAGESEPFDQIPRRAGVSLIGMAIFFLFSLVLRRLDGKSMRVLIPVAYLTAIPACFLYSSVNYTAFFLIHPPESLMKEVASKEHHEGPLPTILWTACEWYFFFVAWASLNLALTYAAKVRLVERRASDYRAVAQTAELRALRYQVNPHFLFNTLNAIATLILCGRNEEAERMTTNLAEFFRASLASDPAEDVSLGDEIRFQRLYLDIERERFPDRLSVAFDVPPELERLHVPGLILQPLVENAIKHSVSQSTRPVAIAIRAERAGETLLLSVEDDGQGDFVPVAGHGVGLRNVRDRLTARFGAAGICSYGPKPGGGFAVELSMPAGG